MIQWICLKVMWYIRRVFNYGLRKFDETLEYTVKIYLVGEKCILTLKTNLN